MMKGFERLPGKHSLFWKLACLLIAFCFSSEPLMFIRQPQSAVST